MSLFSKIVFFFCVLPFSLQSQEVMPVFQTGHFSKVNELMFHPNNQYLISVGDDGKMIVWDINLGLQRSAILAHPNGVIDVDFLNDSTIISLGSNNICKAWSFPNLQLVDEFRINSDSIQALSVLRNDKLCVVGKRVHFYDLTKKQLQTTQYEAKWLFTSVDFNFRYNEILVTGPKENFAVAIDLKDPLIFKAYFLGNIHTAKYADSLSLLASTSGSLRYQLPNARKKTHYTLYDDLNYATDMHANESAVAVGNAFGFTTVFARHNQAVIANIGLDGSAISAIRYNTTGNWLATANTKGTICLYDTDSYKINKILKGASASIVDLKVFDQKMVVGYSDGIIRLVDLMKNQIKSNSIKLDVVEEQNGVNYAVLSVDIIMGNIVYFQVLKTNRHHIQTSLISHAEIVSAEWDLNANEITLKKPLLDRTLNKKVAHNFKQSIPFKFVDYLNPPEFYEFEGAKYYLNSQGYSFYSINDGKNISYDVKHTAPITGLQFLKNDQLVISFSNDGSIRFWDTKGNYLAVLYLSGQYNFFYQNSENFYFASKEILDKIGFIYQNKLFGYEQYDVYYNRPAEVMKELGYFEDEDISDYQKAYFKRLQKLGVLVNELTVSSDLPVIELAYFDEYSTKKEVVNFTLKMADLNGEISSFSYLINGIEKRFELKEAKASYNTEIEIELASGINQIEFFCTNNKGVRSMIKKKIITCEKTFDKPNLYLVTVGVSNYQNKDFNLKYPSQDAGDMALLLSQTKSYSDIHVKSFTDTAFVKGVEFEMDTFLRQANINDVVIFFFAGHGVLDENFNYYLGTHDIDFNNPSQKGFSFDQLETVFENLACRNKLMMIDACFSGEIDKTSLKIGEGSIENADEIQFRTSQSAAIDENGDMGIFELAKRVFTDFKVSKGTNILSSSSGIEYSLEGDKWGNGLFTHVFLQGLQNKAADLNGDKQIRILELQVYLRETVSNLSNGNQNPILRKENIKNNFVIW